MKIVIMLLAVLLSFSLCVANAYESKTQRFRVDFPTGWEIEEDISPGRHIATATHSSGASLAVGSDDQLRNYALLGSRLPLGDFAQYLSTNLFRPLASSMCEEAKPLDGKQGNSNGRKTIQLMVDCDSEILIFRTVFYGSKAYLMIGYGDYKKDLETFTALSNSMSTFQVY